MGIQQPESSKLVLDDCRRLTGPSLVWEKSGAILDVLVSEMEMDTVLECWYRHINALLAQLAWAKPQLTHRRFENGYSLLLAAPLDQLYSAVLILETAWYFCASELLALDTDDPELLVQQLREEMRAEANPALLVLQQSAEAYQVDFLVDDEVVSVGHGEGSLSWPLQQIPAPQQINWKAIHDLPVALITGTNGKSTSVRLLDNIARAAQQMSGVTSTDFVRVGDDILDRGDYSGPGGARLLLRDKRLQVAFLEVARGGILRRGLPLRRARVALITNVGRDHLGQYGVNTLEALVETKFAVHKTLATDGVLVLNADDAGILQHARRIVAPKLCWFSLHKDNAQIQQQIADQGHCCYLDAGELVYFDGQNARAVCPVVDIPMTLGGAAQHNIANALGALGVASAMGYTHQQIRQGLTSFRSNERDNPGRLNLFKLANGASVIVDFAHNAHSVAAVTDTVKRLPARQRWVLFGSAGDRSDADIAAIAEGVCAIKPDQAVIVEVEHYLRGREPGAVSEIMRQVCLREGLLAQQIELQPSPLSGVQRVVAQMQDGDLGLLLVLDQREAVIDYLKQHSQD